MRNIKLVLEYDGSRYNGWQRLGKDEAVNTIENRLLSVLDKMTLEKTELFCGCRTETGVHAYAQVVNFKTKCAFTLLEIKRYLNRYLPMDIAVTEVEEMPERFHSALNAVSKTYLYRVAIGEVPSVFDRKYTYYSFDEPDIDKMKEAAALLIGRHDFKKFSTVKKSKSTEKTILSIDIYGDTSEIQLSITANDFLHNMARMIVSLLLDIGTGKRPVSDVASLLDNGNSEMLSSAPADPKGLFLTEISYQK